MVNPGLEAIITKIKSGALTRREFLQLSKECAVIGGKIGIGGSAIAGIVSEYGCSSSTGPSNDDNGPTPSYGNLSGTVKGLIKKGLMSDVTVSLRGSNYSATTDANGNFEIKSIENPSQYKRVRLRSNNIIDRETNISLGIGENNAEIDVIEADNISGFYYDDYLTVKSEGRKLIKGKEYKVYFYNKTKWEYKNNKWEIVGEVEPGWADGVIPVIKDVLQNDLTAMSLDIYQYRGLLLESEGAEGPGIPTYADKKDGWFVIYLANHPSAYLYTTNFVDNTNYSIISACLSINWNSPSKPTPRRDAFSQDICEWAGFIDTLQKGNKYSIFGFDDQLPDRPTKFDLYAAEIKYKRAFGHGSSGDIPDYDPVGSTSSVRVRNYVPRSSNVNQGFKFETPFDEPNSTKQYGKDYREWLIREGYLSNPRIEEKRRKNLERDIK